VNNFRKKLLIGIFFTVTVLAATFYVAACGTGEFLFVCTLTDGMICDVKDLTFGADVYYNGNKCDVFVTGNEKKLSRNSEGNFVFELDEGENIIVVSASHGNKNVSRSYKAVYGEKKFEIFTDITEKKIVNGLMEFSARAICDGNKCALAVLYEGERLYGSNETYICSLQEGFNNFEFIAGSGAATYVKKETLYLGKFRLNTNLKNIQTDNEVIEFRAIASYDDEVCPVQASVNGESLESVDSRYTYVFQQGGDYEFCLTAVSRTAEYSVSYILTYCNDPPVFDVLTIEDGKICRGDVYTFDVSAKNAFGKKLPASAISFAADFDFDDGIENYEPLDEEEISQVWSDSVKTSYAIRFTVGKYRKAFGKKTVLRITATYGNKRVFKDFSIKYIGPEPNGRIGKVTLSIEAFTISSGYLLEPTSIDVYAGENFARYLCSTIEANGWTYSHTGKIENGFYLSRIEGLDLQGNAIDDKLFSRMTIAGENIYTKNISSGKDGKYALGEFDYTSGSGWMYSVNGVFPNYGFSNYYPQDGDVVRVQFTLCLGKDLGGSDAVGFGGRNYVDDLVDYGKIEALAAEIKANSYYGKGQELLKSVLCKIGVWNVDEETIKSCLSALEKYYLGE